MPRTRTKHAPPVPVTIRSKLHWSWIAVICVVTIVVAASVYAVVRHGSSTGAGAILFIQIEHTPLPPHVGQQLLQEVQTAGGFGSTLDLGDDQKMSRLRDAFAGHPWVRRVERIDRSVPNRLRVELQYRVPVAVALVGRVGMFVDEEGVRVPPPQGSPELAAGLLRLEGSVTPPRGEPGQPWGSPAVEAAARLAGFLTPERQRLGLVAIELEMATLEPELRLRTAGGTRVIWQSLPEERGEKSVSAAEKLARLAAYCEQNEGSLDKPAGPYLLDVRPPGGITRQALEARY